MHCHLLIGLCFSLLLSCKAKKESNPALASQGESATGALVGFVVAQSKLYAVRGQTLFVFDVANPSQANLISSQELNLQLDSIKHNAGYLFLGSPEGVFVYEILENPSKPTYLAHLNFAQACTPLTFYGTNLILSRSTSGACIDKENRVEIYDISDLKSPHLLASHRMHNPKGISHSQSETLFVCDHDKARAYLSSDFLNLEELFAVDASACEYLFEQRDVLYIKNQSSLHLYDIKVNPPVLLSSIKSVR